MKLPAIFAASAIVTLGAAATIHQTSMADTSAPSADVAANETLPEGESPNGEAGPASAVEDDAPPLPAPVPAEFAEWIIKASGECEGVTPGQIAAQLFAESTFRVDAVSYANAQGPAQFTPETWEAWGTDADGDGVKDPFSIPDSVMAQAKYMCHNLESVEQAIHDGKAEGDAVDLALASYNAGFGAILRFGGMPSGGDYTTQTQPYVEKIRDLEQAFNAYFEARV
ncbi:lytic transglycosylase domain-containing protein [Hoyosella subflava]|uniref:NlpC/P60 family protein n=1 Tax=Hoyosella subflava (strain DSM 45089 / JCM 17490 / NBRC 109087 / DQS3-9A1) TaxID=443218 RepID=F6EJU1_HOYSD|nr:lytic transglycosylase domain-containing protein [Hoyosella subflava]AEF40116.1 NlpC/P60 family protein [Hoyosella subflava DQS3-9A1]